jgi:uncharacterized integral membrane protein
MKILYLVLLVLLAGVTLVFALQNLSSVTVAFFSWSLTLPVALVVAGAYVLGMASGGSVMAFLRRAVRGARRPADRKA